MHFLPPHSFCLIPHAPLPSLKYINSGYIKLPTGLSESRQISVWTLLGLCSAPERSSTFDSENQMWKCVAILYLSTRRSSDYESWHGFMPTDCCGVTLLIQVFPWLLNFFFFFFYQVHLKSTAMITFDVYKHNMQKCMKMKANEWWTVRDVCWLTWKNSNMQGNSRKEITFLTFKQI